MKNNQIFFLIMATFALLVTASMLYLTSAKISESAIRQNRIDRRIDSLNRENKILNYKKDSIQQSVNVVKGKVDSTQSVMDSVLFTGSSLFIQHSELK